MRLPVHAAAFAPCLLLIASLAGCASSVDLDPAGYGAPPVTGAIDAQVRADINAKLGERAPDNIVIGRPARAYHTKISFGSNKVLWQGYAVPVVMDVDTAHGRRVTGRHYAAMFSGDRLVGMVDYPGTTNAKGSLGFFWDENAEPAMAATMPAKPKGQPVVASAAPPPNDLLIDPLRHDTGPRSAPVPRNESRVAPTVVNKPGARPAAPQGVAPAAPPAAVPAPPVEAWAPLPAAPAAGTRVYLASDKSYAGVVAEYAELHAFAHGAAKPAVLVRYLNGAENWFTVGVARQVYVVRQER